MTITILNAAYRTAFVGTGRGKVVLIGDKD